MSSGFGNNKIKPEDLFSSLKTMRKKDLERSSVANKFFERFSSKMTNSEGVSFLKGESNEVKFESYGR